MADRVIGLWIGMDWVLRDVLLVFLWVMEYWSLIDGVKYLYLMRCVVHGLS